MPLHPLAFFVSMLNARRLVAAALLLLAALPARAELGVDWTYPVQNPWQNSGRATQAFTFNSKMWVATVPKLWSSNNGTSWSLVSALSYGDLVVFKGKIWAVARGGKAVYSSTDGTSWSTATNNAPWAENHTGENSSFVHNNRLWTLRFGDTNMSLYSSDDGIHWTLVSGALPPGRREQPAITSFAGKIWLMGGYKIYSRWINDVWSSSDGKNWTQETAHAPWIARQGLTAFVHDGELFIAGGYVVRYVEIDYYNSYFETVPINDLWSTPDGVHWTKISDYLPTLIDTDIDPEYYARPAVPMLSFGGKIWMFTDSACYSFLPPGTPILARIQNATMQEGYAYACPPPRLIQGTKPVTWSVVGPPAGMSVNPQTGVVAWPWPLTRSQPYRIRLRAINSFGSGETSWTLTVGAQPPPQLSTSSYSKNFQTTLTWSAVPMIGGYTLQCDDDPSFATPLSTTTLSSTTLRHIYSGLQDDKTVWFRVRGNKLDGLTALWSNVTSCTRDASPPAAWMTAYDHSPEWPLAVTARLFLAARDPGTKPSGVHQMRFSVNNRDWTAWQPFDSRASFWLGRTGTRRIFGQVSDRMGNVRDISTTVTCGLIDALYVDDDNTSGPWSGTLERPYRKIQDAIDASNHGQTVVVAPGTYYEKIDFKGKNILLRSADPQSPVIVKTTVIDAQYKGPAVSFKGIEDAGCVLAGFTIAHGYALDEKYWENSFIYRGEPEKYTGGGIKGHGTHATLKYNRILNNIARLYDYDRVDSYILEHYYYGKGGGIAQCHGLISNNVIAFNGLGFYATSSPASVGSEKPNTIQDVDIMKYDLSGAALYDCDGTIVNNTIWGNSALIKSSVLEQCNGLLRNNILWNPGMTELAHSAVPVRCCLPSAGQYPSFGNIPSNPRLADPAGGDFRLLPGSPCIDAGIFSSLAPFDIDGDRRGSDAATARRGDGSDFDIGADEFTPPDPAILLLEPHGGETFEAGGEYLVKFVLDPARAGTLAGFEVRNAAGQRIKGWRLSATEALAGQIRHMPEAGGSGFRLRVFNNANTSVYTESPPFAIRGRNAVARESWTGYR